MPDLRTWQREALTMTLPRIEAGERGVIHAVMGAGKSRVILELCRTITGWVVITAPTVALVDQLSATLSELGETIGQRYTRASTAPARVTVACCPSAPDLARDLAFEGRELALWIADEAHRTETATMHGALSVVSPRAVLGLTATPYLREEDRSLQLYQSMWYSYTARQAVQDGVIVPWRVVTLDGEGECSINDACVYLIRTQQGPGVVNALRIDDCEEYARVLCEHGIPARAVHSQRRDMAQSIEDLRAGALKCLVHVDMLREGVDMPWLRWLCLRRPQRSRVAAVQEIGRVLRAHEGKTEGVILDPRDQMPEIAVGGYEATLGTAGYEPETASTTRGTPEERADALLHVDEPAARIRGIRRWLRDVITRLEIDRGYERPVKRGHWRLDPPSMRQVEAVGRMAWAVRLLPDPVRDLLGRACTECATDTDWRRGDVSDLLDVLIQTSPRNGGWIE